MKMKNKKNKSARIILAFALTAACTCSGSFPMAASASGNTPEPTSETAQVRALTSSDTDFTVSAKDNGVMITGYTGSDVAVTIPSSINGEPVIAVDDYAFADNTNIQSVILSEGIQSLGESSFAECTALKTVTVPASVTQISAYAFESCSSLTDITFKGKTNNCQIGEDFPTYTIESQVKIHGYCGSSAYYFAKQNGRTFVFTGGHTMKSEIIAKAMMSTSLSGKIEYSDGKIETKCTVCGGEKTTQAIASPKTITLSKTSYTWDGKSHKPTLKIKDRKGNAISASNYTVAYPSGRKNVGVYEIRITFKGSKYFGTTYKTFTIKPDTAKIKSTSGSGKAIAVKWKAEPSQATGYQIQYATKASMKNVKTKTAKGKSTASATVSGLKSSTKYYIRIHAYKDVKNPDGKTIRLYSAWSGKKTAKTN